MLAITFEDASKRLKQQGKTDKDSYKGWNEPCKFTFIDGTVSTNHTPKVIYLRKWKSLPIIGFTLEYAKAKMKLLGNKIVESTFNGWSKPCTIIFSDGTKSKHSPSNVSRLGWTKPNSKLRMHTFESANDRMMELGNKIVESTYKGWGEPCTIIFKNGSKSTKHPPREVYSRSRKSKPRNVLLLEHTFESANDRMLELGNKIVESTYKRWQEPCTIIFSDNSVSNKHKPCQIYIRRHKSKPGKGGPNQNTLFLYIMNFSEIVGGKTDGLKIGIAKNLSTRVNNISSKLDKGELVLHKVFKFHLYKYCKQAEVDIKKLIRAPKSICKNFGDGKTEVYAVDQLKPAMKIIRKYIRAHKCFEYTY